MLGESLRERFGERPEVPIRHEAIKLLASDTRLSILKHLDKRRMTVSELARVLHLNKSTVHEHLAKLVEGGLIKRDESPDREWVYYELTKTARYVLQPSSARFVLMFAGAVFAALVGIALLHVILASGQGLAVEADQAVVPAGLGRSWTVDVTQPGLLGLRQPATGASLYLLDAEQAAGYQLSGALPSDARKLGVQEGLRSAGEGRWTFRTALEPGVHYLLAATPGEPQGALFPLRAEAVRVEPRAPTVLLGIDPPQVEVAVRFNDAPLDGGVVQAVDEVGHAFAEVPVLQGRAFVPVHHAADEVRFRFKPADEGSAFAPAEGRLVAAVPHVAFEPTTVPLHAQTDVRVVVDDPELGPRAGAVLRVVRPDGSLVAEATTGASGQGALVVRPLESGELIVKAGAREVGRLVAKPGLRLWTEPGPRYEGEAFRLRTHVLADDPAVGLASLYLDGREVGMTDEKGWFALELVFPGRYQLEARREGYLPAKLALDVLPRQGWLLPQLSLGPGFSAASRLVPGSPDPVQLVQDRQVLLGTGTRVEALLRNPDDLPRIVRAELREDGEVLEVRGVQLGPRASQWVVFDYVPRVAGLHLVQVNEHAPLTVEALTTLAAAQPVEARSVPGPGLAPLLAGVAVAAACLAARRR